MTIVTLVSGCGNPYPGDGTRDGAGAGEGNGEQRQRPAGEPPPAFTFPLESRDPAETIGFVSLRVEARDQDGNRAEQEVTRAMTSST